MENSTEKHDFNLQLSSQSFQNEYFFRKFLVSQKVEDKRFYQIRFEMLNIHDSHLKNIQWINCEIKTSEITQTYFNGNYFKEVVFIDTTFHEVYFINCVFDNCKFNQDLSSITLKNCTFLNMRASKVDSSNLIIEPVKIEVQSTEKVSEPSLKSVTVTPTKENDRFGVLDV